MNMGCEDPDSKRKTEPKIHMKFKVTILAAVLAVAGVAPLSAELYDSKYNPNPGSHPHGTPAAVVKNPCCDVQIRLVEGPDRKGYLTRQEVTCKENCKAAHAGKNCSPADARKCAK